MDGASPPSNEDANAAKLSPLGPLVLKREADTAWAAGGDRYSVHPETHPETASTPTTSDHALTHATTQQTRHLRTALDNAPLRSGAMVPTYARPT